MIFPFSKRLSADLVRSKLLNECTFFAAFKDDLLKCKQEVVIESPLITLKRTDRLLPTLLTLRRRGVKVTINTRDPQEHDALMSHEAYGAISILQNAGTQVLFTGAHHRKLAILDRKILYEGSLNVLSQNNSCEVMRRIESEKLAREMITFVGLDRFLS